MNATHGISVVKVGGDELVPGPALGQLVLWTARQVRRGQRLVLVHGGGDEVTERAEVLGLATERHAGQRVTSDAMLEVVAEVLAGRVNVRLTNALESAGVPAVGLSGVSARILPVRRAGSPPGSLGWVGEPLAARCRLLLKLLEEGLTPVVAPLGTDGAGGVFNVNADLAAGAIAEALGASLYLVSDVDGVLDADGVRLPTLVAADVRRLVGDGVARDGMIPKLTAATRAVGGGAPLAWVGSLAALGDDPVHPKGGTRILGGRPPVPVLGPASEGGA